MARSTDDPTPYTLFIVALSVLSLLLVAVHGIWDLDEESRQILGQADLVLCLFFFYDFVHLLVRSDNRARYLYTWGWLDFISSIPAVWILRAARSARIVRVIRVLRTVRAARIMSSMVLKRRRENAVYAMILFSLVIVVVSSIAILEIEKGSPGANIQSADDALWWTITTITTVGYGDRYPVTREGRLVAAGVMFSGVGLFGTLTAAVASWFVSGNEKKEDQ